ncbi:MAG: NeuD/PglB/VioB family sugar acetyltransferase [Anaerolineales bacterium]
MPQIPVLVPLLNANEPEARLVEIHVKDGQPVQKGDLLFTIETTKAASDVESPESGFARLIASEGDTLSVGAVLAYITETADESVSRHQLPASSNQYPGSSNQASVKSHQSDLRMTKQARALAESLGLDLSSLPTGRLITESFIRQITQSQNPSIAQSHNLAITKSPSAQILLYGAGGHAKAVLEMIQAIGAFGVAGIVDDNPALTGTSVLGVPVLGTRAALPGLLERGVLLAANGVGGIINIEIRVKLFELLADYGFVFPILRHPRATVEPSARLEDGVQVFANAYVGSAAVLHERCMVNTGAIVSHDCEIGRYAHLAPGCLLAGHVQVGERALVGMGVTTIIGLKIGEGARVGNGAVLLADVAPRQIVPAGKVWAG